MTSVDNDVRNEFKAEVSKNGVDMSSVIEKFMINYIKISRDKRKKRYENLKNSNNE